MKLSFTTLGCPQWDLSTIIRRAAEYGFDGVDFRGVGKTLDVTMLPEFTTGVAAIKRQFDDAGLVISGISSSIQVCQAARRTAHLEEARRTIALAHVLDCHYVRLFGGKLDQAGRTSAVTTGRECIEAILALDGARDLRWLLETHDDWIRHSDCRLLLDGIPDPAFGILWDVAHTWQFGGETPAETYAALGRRVGGIHIKDAAQNPQGLWQYVLPGAGKIPLAEAVRVLKGGGYDGYFTFEHEKRWHPELPEPEIAFPAFIQWARNLEVR